MKWLSTRILIPTFALFGTFAGCYRSALIQPETLDLYPESEIVVSTRGGENYNFAGNQHAVITSDNGQKVIRGKAKRFVGNGPQFQWFEGDIAFQDVTTISTPEKTEFYYLGLMYITVAILAAFLLAYYLPIKGVG